MAKRATRGSAFQHVVFWAYANKRAAKKQHEGYCFKENP